MYKPMALVLVGMLAGMLSACADRAEAGHLPIHPKEMELREGDVVFRLGGGLTSRAVLSVDPDGAYSHVGMVVREGNRLMIVHAVPDEPDFEGDPDRVKLDAPDRFFAKMNALAGEVCRPADSLVARRAARVALEYFSRRILFDHRYDDKDTTAVYCTELIAHAFRRAGRPIVGTPAHRFTLPGLQVVCWLPSDIHRSRFLKTVYKF